MHTYLITTKSGRWQQAARTWSARLLIGVGLLGLGLIVLTIRCLRLIVNLLASAVVRIELEISIRTGLPSAGASLGTHLAEAFMHEFRTAARSARTEHERTAR